MDPFQNRAIWTGSTILLVWAYKMVYFTPFFVKASVLTKIVHHCEPGRVKESREGRYVSAVEWGVRSLEYTVVSIECWV
jgi:hypothetical protein